MNYFLPVQDSTSFVTLNDRNVLLAQPELFKLMKREGASKTDVFRNIKFITLYDDVKKILLDASSHRYLKVEDRHFLVQEEPCFDGATVTFPRLCLADGEGLKENEWVPLDLTPPSKKKKEELVIDERMEKHINTMVEARVAEIMKSHLPQDLGQESTFQRTERMRLCFKVNFERENEVCFLVRMSKDNGTLTVRIKEKEVQNFYLNKGVIWAMVHVLVKKRNYDLMNGGWNLFRQRTKCIEDIADEIWVTFPGSKLTERFRLSSVKFDNDAAESCYKVDASMAQWFELRLDQMDEAEKQGASK